MPLNTRLDLLGAILGLAMVDVLFTLGGLALLLRRLDRQRVRDTGTGASLAGANVTQGVETHTVDAAVSRAAAAVDAAVTWYPRPSECLPRAVVMTRLLRRWGVPAALVIGIRQMPFYAHAWVEVHGVAVADQDEVRPQCSVIQRCEPVAR